MRRLSPRLTPTPLELSFGKISSGSLFVVDEGDSKSDRKQILDEGGYEPQLEYSESWEGGSHDSTVVAVEKTADGYALAIKHEDSYTTSDYPDPTGGVTTNEDSASGDSEKMVFWEISI